MEGYRVLLGNLQDATWYEEIPVSRINFSHYLNGPGKCDISTSPNPQTQAYKDKISTEYIKPGRSTIYIEKDGIIVGAYILWELYTIFPTNRLRLIGEGFWSYFRRRIISSDTSYTNTEQLYVARGLINDALSKVQGSIVGISCPLPATSFTQITKEWFGYERKGVAQAIEELGDRENGFDFSIESQWIAGASPPSIANTVEFYANGKGTDAENSTVVFDLDANLMRLSWQQKAQKFANKVYVIGAGQAEDTTLVESQSTGSYVEGYPLLETKVTRKDLEDTTLISEVASRELKKKSQLYEILQLEVDPRSIETRLGSFTTGDIARVRAQRGFIDIDKYYRVMSYDVWVNEDSNEEKISLDMSTVEATE